MSQQHHQSTTLHEEAIKIGTMVRCYCIVPEETERLFCHNLQWAHCMVCCYLKDRCRSFQRHCRGPPKYYPLQKLDLSQDSCRVQRSWPHLSQTTMVLFLWVLFLQGKEGPSNRHVTMFDSICKISKILDIIVAILSLQSRKSYWKKEPNRENTMYSLTSFLYYSKGT